MGRRIVVTSLLGAAVACGHKEPPAKPDPPVTNPPGPEMPVAPAPDRMSQNELTRYTRVLNGVDAEQRRIFRRSDGTCYVNLPPPSEPPMVSFRPPPQLPVECPPHMQDPSWLGCAFGTVEATEDASACVCIVMGNPPPPPRPLDPCPTLDAAAGTVPAAVPEP